VLSDAKKQQVFAAQQAAFEKSKSQRNQVKVQTNPDELLQQFNSAEDTSVMRELPVKVFPYDEVFKNDIKP